MSGGACTTLVMLHFRLWISNQDLRCHVHPYTHLQHSQAALLAPHHDPHGTPLGQVHRLDDLQQSRREMGRLRLTGFGFWVKGKSRVVLPQEIPLTPSKCGKLSVLL